MTKESDTSRDGVKCRCGIIASISEDDSSPVKFSEEKGEYTLDWVTDTGIPNSFVIRFCPFCGGQMSPSGRTSPFIAIPPSERVRLKELLKDVSSLEGALTLLGEPDSDDANSFGVQTPVKKGQPSRATYPRVLTYTKLSELANVRIIEDALGLKIFYEGKPRKKGIDVK